MFQNSPTFAAQMDANDALASYRERFFIPQTPAQQPVLYLTGHSLGLQPKTVPAAIQSVLADWQNLGVLGHMVAEKPWVPFHESVTAPLAHIVGAKPEEVVAANSSTVNLHLLMISFYRPTPTRYKILLEANAFPSDQYAAQSHLQLHHRSPQKDLLEVLPDENGQTSTDAFLQVLEEQGDQIALVLLGGVNYLSGQLFDIEKITQAARAKGCVVGVDIAHAAGNVLLQLHDWQVDFAVWCHYKYLNAGPGAIGGMFVHEKHLQDKSLPRLTGWWGHNKATRFAMPKVFDPIQTAESWQISNPPIFQLAALQASVDIFLEAGMPALVEKSKLLTGFLEFLLNDLDAEKTTLVTPTDPNARGCQLSFKIADAEKIQHQLLSQHVICDFRPPNILRVAPVPLYNSFADVYQFVTLLREYL